MTMIYKVSQKKIVPEHSTCDLRYSCFMWRPDKICHSERALSPEESAFRGRAVRDKRYYVYILASKSRTLYVGVTGRLMARTLQHKSREEGFTSRYRIDRPVYFESFQYVNNAIARETEIKAWRREKKVALIVANNPTWEESGR